MLKNNSLKKSISILLVSVYTFVVLFSAKFHHHSHSFFSETDFVKTEKSVKAFTNIFTENDCVACHFLTNKISFSPEEFSYQLLSFGDFSKTETTDIYKVISSEILFFNLRAPPQYFI